MASKRETILEVGAYGVETSKLCPTQGTKIQEKYKGLWKLIRACKHSYDPFSNLEKRG